MALFSDTADPGRHRNGGTDLGPHQSGNRTGCQDPHLGCRRACHLCACRRLVAILQTSRRAPSHRQQPHPAHDGRRYAAAASAEVDLRPEASRPGMAAPHLRRLYYFFGETSRRLSVRPCHPCRRAGVGRHGAAAHGTLPRLVDRRRPGADMDRSVGALDQRCDRRARDRRRGGTAGQALDGFGMVAPE